MTLDAQGNIAHYVQTASGLVDDSSKELPDNWLYRRGSTGGNGAFSTLVVGSHDHRPVHVVVDRLQQLLRGSRGVGWWKREPGSWPQYQRRRCRGRDQRENGKALTWPANILTPAAATSLETGGGTSLSWQGNSISGGAYYVERGHGLLAAGGSIVTNGTRAALDFADLATQDSLPGGPDPTTELPTTLFLGQGSFNITADGNLLLGAVANPFLLPQGTDNAFYQLAVLLLNIFGRGQRHGPRR